ncbi:MULTISPECIES: hypothetical protein [unclassified Paenibacillus]|uniref:hypothetical protein n=1 Tax=unclassified Paenibacillus TaxID=185978 RepID=UPI001B6DD9A9|nr:MULTISPECIES: hypothetical protein [unclassified Paenibacillus]MBP1156965.1 hypothetical protein [Paenibacillus sp. PvP091]MBP1172296.1 hypothetical protein [Paenibacillus sp. PvR098]MBP2438677.1 hypothetical protein [Paenibacillus sp. PvP052]
MLRLLAIMQVCSGYFPVKLIHTVGAVRRALILFAILIAVHVNGSFALAAQAAVIIPWIIHTEDRQFVKQKLSPAVSALTKLIFVIYIYFCVHVFPLSLLS